ncbi:MAG: NADH-quinone oxidoreductase subunit M [Gammaproteobacteria bacterium]|nr:MAG: NADH-quinone oxidoreductase subunit M [Gammaproteobacteria bacterium]
MFADHLLTVSIWLPILGGILVLVLGSDERKDLVRQLSLGVSVLTFLVTIPLWTGFDRGTAAMQFVEKADWIRPLHIQYFLGVDGFSMPLILLTSFMTILVVIAGWVVIKKHQASYMAAFLIMEGLMIGVFSALDAILFYVFWEATLLPMYLIIGIWGGDNRVYAAIKFFLYTLLGSLLMLVAMIYLYYQAGHSFSILDFHAAPIGETAQILLFLAFFAAFAVKIPMWPVHTWLPDAHVQAPTGGSVILAAIMLKMGGYGFLRFNLPILPDASHALAGFMITLSLIAVVYIAFVALVQTDMKKLIAYSSISHMGFVTLGFFLFNEQGIEGGMVQMISHGFVSGAMFLCVGVLYDRMHTRDISAYGGVGHTMPMFAAFMMLFTMANTGLPGTSGFVGELLVILGAFKTNIWLAVIAATTLVFGAAYSLWLYKRVIFGPVVNDDVKKLTDISRREALFLGLLAVFVLGIGLYPGPLLDVMHASVENLVAQASLSKL